MRLGEVLGLRWDDVDLACGAIRLSDAKTGARTVPLGAPAMAFLASLDREGDYVAQGFEGPAFWKLWHRASAPELISKTSSAVSP